MKATLEGDAVIRSLYIYGPAGVQTIAADLERRDVSTADLGDRLARLVTGGQAAVREVAIAGQTVRLFYLAGNGVG
jgi:hypothetical protein